MILKQNGKCIPIGIVVCLFTITGCMSDFDLTEPDTSATDTDTHTATTGTDTNTGSDTGSNTNTSTDSATDTNTDTGTTATTDTDSATDTDTGPTDTNTIDTNTDTGPTDTNTTDTNMDTATTDTNIDTATTDTNSDTADTDTVSDTDTDTGADTPDTDTNVAECTQAQRRCSPVTGAPQLCTAMGLWKDEPSCQYACLNGFCTGECTPGQKRCDALTGIPQECDSLGQWQNKDACQTGALCAAGDCVCTGGLTDCAGMCVDTTENAEHCGACGHSCLGGACTDENCQPIILATPSGLNVLSTDLGLSDTYIYLIYPQKTQISRIPKTGGTFEIVIDSTTLTSAAIAANDTVYWAPSASTDGNLYQHLAGETDSVIFASITEDVEQIVLADGFVYWDQQYDDHTEIMAKPVDASSSPVAVASFDATFGGFTIADGCTYLNTGTQVIRYCSMAPQSETILFSRNTRIKISPMNSRDDNFVYVGIDGYGVIRVSRSLPVQTDLIAAATTPKFVVTGGEMLYYIDGDNGGQPACTDNWGLFSLMPQPGSAPVELISPPMDCPEILQIDDEAIYWINRESPGGIMKLAL